MLRPCQKALCKIRERGDVNRLDLGSITECDSSHVRLGDILIESHERHDSFEFKHRVSHADLWGHVSQGPKKDTWARTICLRTG